MKGKVYLAMDIETTGQYLGRNAMIALGMVVMDDEMNILKNFTVCLKENGKEREERCMSEFWGKQPAELFDNIMKNGIDPSIAMNSLVDWLLDVESTYGDRLVVLSDNPSYDVAWINYYLSTYSTRPMLYYGWNEQKQEYEYRRIWDTDSVFHGALAMKKGEIVEWGLEKELDVQNVKWSNSHVPEEDASNIAANYILFVKNNCETVTVPVLKKSKTNSSSSEEEEDKTLEIKSFSEEESEKTD